MSRNPSSAPDPLNDDDDSTRSRADDRRIERELELTLAKLARDLVALGAGQLNRLELPESVLDVVVDARAMTSPAAMNRQLRLVRSVLRDVDWSLVRGRLESLVRHGTIPAELATSDTPAARAHEWVARLLGEGQDAIDALLRLNPNADRTHLWTLLRQARKAAAGRRERAEQRLAQAIESLLRSVE
jgi:ribosome-associated protein